MNKRKKKPPLWRNCEIPAKLFFEILETGKLAKLVKRKTGSKPRTKDLVKAWEAIFDEFFTLKDSQKMRLILKVKNKILRLSTRIELIERVLRSFALVKYPDQEQLARMVEKLRKFRVKINPDGDLYEELLKALRNDLPALKTALEVEKENLNNLTKGEKTTFEENCVALEGFGWNIAEDVSLRRYLAYDKAAHIKAKKNRKDGRE